MPGAFDENFAWTYHPTYTVANGPAYVASDCTGTTTHAWSTITTEHDLDKLARKIYRIFSEHINIDITEDEFINLLQETKDE